MKSRYLVEIAGIAALLAMIGLGYRYAPDLLARGDANVSMPDCDPGKTACVIDLPQGGRVEFRLSPQPVPLMKPFRAEVQVSGINPRQMDVDFSAVGMDMGFNRPRLNEESAGHFAATTSLPVCITGPMQWQATLMIQTWGGRIAIPFRFSTHS